MLVDFTVENYRSIKEAVTLSAVAQRSPARAIKRRAGVVPDMEIAPPFAVEGREFGLLPVLAIFGANASGKTNVLKALDGMLSFISPNVRMRENPVVDPFLFDSQCRSKPVKFMLRLAISGNLYIYELSITQSVVMLEALHYIPAEAKRNAKRLLFERRWDEASARHVWSNGTYFGTQFAPVQVALRQRESYLNLLFRSLTSPVIEPVWDWLALRWDDMMVGSSSSDNFRRTAEILKYQRPELAAPVASMIERFDTGINNIEISREPGSNNGFEVTATHNTDRGSVSLPLFEESAGSQQLFVVATSIQMALSYGSLLLVDELGGHLHPNITREIVRLFQSPITNPKRAQLIFTSHDNTLHGDNLLRRDQIWFTQKRNDGSTDLYPLTDFHPRNDLAIDRAYLDGRFGAVPILPDTFDLLSVHDKAA